MRQIDQLHNVVDHDLHIRQFVDKFGELFELVFDLLWRFAVLVVAFPLTLLLVYLEYAVDNVCYRVKVQIGAGIGGLVKLEKDDTVLR